LTAPWPGLDFTAPPYAEWTMPVAYLTVELDAVSFTSSVSPPRTTSSSSSSYSKATAVKRPLGRYKLLPITLTACLRLRIERERRYRKGVPRLTIEQLTTKRRKRRYSRASQSDCTATSGASREEAWRQTRRGEALKVGEHPSVAKEGAPKEAVSSYVR
jgi:hypothetical protein